MKISTTLSVEKLAYAKSNTVFFAFILYRFPIHLKRHIKTNML